jgi:hypothetical protein
MKSLASVSPAFETPRVDDERCPRSHYGVSTASSASGWMASGVVVLLCELPDDEVTE